METVIAAIIAALVPVVLLSLGITNRDKRDRKLKQIAEELGMVYEAQRIDARRRKRITNHVQTQGVAAVTQIMTRTVLGLAIIANIFLYIPAIRSLIEGEVDFKVLGLVLVGIGFGLSLLALIIATVWAKIVRTKADRMKP